MNQNSASDDAELSDDQLGAVTGGIGARPLTNSPPPASSSGEGGLGMLQGNDAADKMAFLLEFRKILNKDAREDRKTSRP